MRHQVLRSEEAGAHVPEGRSCPGGRPGGEADMGTRREGRGGKGTGRGGDPGHGGRGARGRGRRIRRRGLATPAPTARVCGYCFEMECALAYAAFSTREFFSQPGTRSFREMKMGA